MTFRVDFYDSHDVANLAKVALRSLCYIYHDILSAANFDDFFPHFFRVCISSFCMIIIISHKRHNIAEFHDFDTLKIAVESFLR